MGQQFRIRNFLRFIPILRALQLPIIRGNVCGPPAAFCDLATLACSLALPTDRPRASRDAKGLIILLCRQKVPGIFFFFVTPETAMPLAGAADSERDEAKRPTDRQ